MVTRMIPGQRALSRAFAEFSLLPALLSYGLRWSSGSWRLPEEEVTLRDWRFDLENMEVNTDHVLDDDIPNRMKIEQYMAEDVWHLVHRLGLVTARGELSPIAQSLIEHYRTENDDLALQKMLAEVITREYRGALGMPIAPLLQECARQLAKSDTDYSPGLLLVEFQYLIELAHFDGFLAPQQPELMAARRDEALRGIDLSPPGSGPDSDLDALEFQNIIEHADAVADYYLSNLISDDDSSMTITELRSTAMLFTYTGLLDELYPLGPVQCLAVPKGE